MFVNKKKQIKIGILGGTFDPAHKGHIKISKEAKKRFKLNHIIWAITKKNPFKSRSSLNLKSRINFARKITSKEKFIKVGYYEKKIKSNKTINLISHFKNNHVYFIMGADNLISFHKWQKYEHIVKLCRILVFDRNGYKSKALKSLSFRKYNKKTIKFIKFDKVNISSSQLRKI